MDSIYMIPKIIVIHHTNSSRDLTKVNDIDAWHKLRWADFKGSLGYWIGYHFIITGNGDVTQTRKETELGAHCIPNDGKIGICLTGNFEIEEPTKEQLLSLAILLERLKISHNLIDEQIKGHYQFSQTLCPGKFLITWLNKYRLKSFLTKLKELLKLLLLRKLNL